MKKIKNEKRKFFIILIILFTFGLIVGYAILTQRLNIDNVISYGGMTWDVGFSNVEDYGGTIIPVSSIDNEGETITVNCNFGLSTKQESCIVKATITNNGTFDIGLTSDQQ